MSLPSQGHNTLSWTVVKRPARKRKDKSASTVCTSLPCMQGRDLLGDTKGLVQEVLHDGLHVDRDQVACEGVREHVHVEEVGAGAEETLDLRGDATEGTAEHGEVGKAVAGVPEGEEGGALGGSTASVHVERESVRREEVTGAVVGDRPCDGSGEDNNVSVEGIRGEVFRDGALGRSDLMEERKVEHHGAKVHDVAERDKLGDGVVDGVPEVELGEGEVVVAHVPAHDEEREAVVEDRGHVEVCSKDVLHHEAAERAEDTVDNVRRPESASGLGRVQAVHEEHEAERDRRVKGLFVVRDRFEQGAVGEASDRGHGHVVVPGDGDSGDGANGHGEVDHRVIEVDGASRGLFALLRGLAAGHVVVFFCVFCGEVWII
mmetsp:Transcript_22996/g.54478  ORF Transcript_22996/g.54478 Transcript_22996/m.54478 type:complete len:375 (+) Transcript_22996:384-1508(+)